MKTLQSILFALLCLYSVVADAHSNRNLLQKAADLEMIKSVLVANQEWVTYPTYTDRAGWDKLFGNTKEEIVRRGEKQLNYEWKVVKATDYIEFEKSGSREIMETPFGTNNAAMVDLLLAELAEGQGRFTKQLINGVFHTCEMTSWALSAHLITQKVHRSLPDHREQLIDLTSGDLSSMLSWTYYFLHNEFDKVNPSIAIRLRHELEKRTLEPYMNEENYYWWQAFRATPTTMVNNWNPWCNSNVLQTMMLLENDPDKLAAGIYRTMQSVDRFLNYVHADGACEEGPSYWGHAAGKTLDYLELLSDITGGEVRIFQEPMIRNMGEYISRSYVGNGWVVNFADASARGGGDAYLIYRFGKAVGSDELKGFAALMRKSSALPWNGRDIFRTLASIAISQELNQAAPKHEVRPFTWYPETEFCYLSTKEEVFLAAKGGHNDESHNHNDVGTCSVWFNQTPILIDAGVGTYTRQTFSGERYSIWTMQSDYHNLPMINGVSEQNGKKYKATEVKADKNSFSVNIATAYPKEAKAKKWIRSYNVKGKQVQINDSFELEEAVAPNVINFMTWGEIDRSEKGKVYIRVKDVKAQLLYDANKFELSVESKEMDDPKLSNVWGESISRLSFKAKQSSDRGDYTFTIKKR